MYIILETSNAIILNSKRMKRLNKDVVKADNRCFRCLKRLKIMRTRTRTRLLIVFVFTFIFWLDVIK